MADLTAITTPFGLLDRETQEALKAHGGPYERFTALGNWVDLDLPEWVPGHAYRVKTAPPKPRERWLRIGPNGEFITCAAGDRGAALWREVLPE